jgi:RNA polymerase sigma-70 factor (ECF subfamily)
MREDVSEKTDEEVIFLIQSGKIEFFDTIICRYEDRIKRYAWKFLSDGEDINDVIQDIFIKSYINIQSFDTKRKFSSWIFRIAHNELINTLKKRKKKTLPLFNLDIFFPQHPPNLNDGLNQQIDRHNIEKMINETLDQIESKYREPIILYYLEDLTYKEIADVMEIPISTVGIRIKRAKEIMQLILKKSGYVYEQ